MKMSLVLKPAALDRFRLTGYVVFFTVKRRTSGVYDILDEKKTKIGSGYVTMPVAIHPTLEEMENYLPYSGYPSVVAWLSEIKLTYREIPRIGYLHLVVKTPLTRELVEEASKIPVLGDMLKGARLPAIYVQPPPKPPPVKRPVTVTLSRFLELPEKPLRKLEKITPISVTYYPSSPPPAMHSIVARVKADDVEFIFTQTMFTPLMRIPKSETEWHGEYCVLESTVIPMPTRPRFWLGDYVETPSKTYLLVKATTTYKKGKYTPWRWTVRETDKLLGTVVEYELTEDEWDERRRLEGAPPYMEEWTWARIPEKTLPVLKPTYPALRRPVPIPRKVVT